MKENIKYEDFLPKNTFIMNWMLRYLPENRRVQDIVVLVVGSLISFFPGAIAVNHIPQGVGQPIVMLIGPAMFVYNYLWRNLVAAARCKRAKRDVK